ncbi:MAG TPA: DUF4383 domain-containing protein [Mycobacteriales bacterium]|nr:DUF4383 domain-containing protein [Mycobacteriales bacterium]
MTTRTAKGGAATRSVNTLVGMVLGVVYLLVGLVGFTVTGGTDFAAHHGNKLLGLFEINPLHNLVHILVGVLLAGAAYAGLGLSRAVNTLVGAIYLFVGVIGLFILDNSANILALNGFDNVLHFGSALVLLGIGLAADRELSTS